MYEGWTETPLCLLRIQITELVNHPTLGFDCRTSLALQPYVSN